MTFGGTPCMPGGGWMKIWPGGCTSVRELELVVGSCMYWLWTGGTGRTVTSGPGGIVGVRECEYERLDGL